MKCRVCGGSVFDVYGRGRKNLESQEDGVPPPATDLQTSYIECVTCNTTVYGIEGGWYPTYESDKERWSYRYQGKSFPTEEQLLDEIKKLGKDKLELLIKNLKEEAKNAVCTD